MHSEMESWAEQRRDLIAAGLCTGGCGRKPRDGKRQCAECARRTNGNSVRYQSRVRGLGVTGSVTASADVERITDIAGATQAFEENRNQLMGIARLAALRCARYGDHFDDLFQDASIVFLRCFVRLDAGRGQLQNYMSRAARRTTERQTRMVRRRAVMSTSLDAPISADSETMLVDLVPSDTPVSAPERAVDLSEALGKAIAERLSSQEALVLRRHYLDDDEPTLADIGREMGLTGERARKIEKKALEKLRGRRAGLRELVDG